MDDFNLKNVDELLARAIVLDCCEHTSRQINEIKAFISDPGILARVEATTLQLLDEAFVKLENHDQKRFFRASASGLRWRDVEMNALFSQEEIVENCGITPEFAIQSRERQSLIQRAERIWTDVFALRAGETVGLGSGQNVPSPNEFNRAASIQKIANHIPNGVLESAAHLLAVKKYILTFVLGWEFENVESEYLLVRRHQTESIIDVVLMRSKRHGKTPFSKAGLALMSDSIWDQTHSTAPLWAGQVGTRYVTCDVLNAIFKSIDAVAVPVARRGLQKLWSKIYPPTAIEPLNCLAKRYSKKTKNAIGEKTKLPIVRYQRKKKRYAELMDNKGVVVKVSWHSVQFLLAYVNKKSGRPLPAVTPEQALKGANIESRKPAVRVRQLFKSLQSQMKKFLADQPPGRRSESLGQLSEALYTTINGRRILRFILLPAPKVERRRRRSKLISKK